MLDRAPLFGLDERLLTTLAARAQAAEALAFDDPLARRLAVELAPVLPDAALDRATLRGMVLREQWFDARVRDFARRHPTGRVVDLACGLDTAHARLAQDLPADFAWIDLDLPEVIAARRRLIGEPAGTGLLAGDPAEDGWMELLGAPQRPTLFLAEGALLTRPPAAVERLLQRLAARFPGAELVFDYVSPRLLRHGHRSAAVTHLRLGRDETTPFRWALKRAADLALLLRGTRVLAEHDPLPRIGTRAAIASGLHRAVTGGRLLYGLAHVRLGGEPRL